MQLFQLKISTPIFLIHLNAKHARCLIAFARGTTAFRRFRVKIAVTCSLGNVDAYRSYSIPENSPLLNQIGSIAVIDL